jgi:hypothetical protein
MSLATGVFSLPPCGVETSEARSLGLGVGVPQAQLPAWTPLPNPPPQGREYVT